MLSIKIKIILSHTITTPMPTGIRMPSASFARAMDMAQDFVDVNTPKTSRKKSVKNTMLASAACVQLSIRAILAPAEGDASSATGSITSTCTPEKRLTNTIIRKRRKRLKSQHDYPKEKERIVKSIIV